MKQSEAWIVQVKSDFAAGEVMFDENSSESYCQAIGKYQQTVEKSVKAMIAAVNDLGSNLAITRSHLPTDEITALLGIKSKIDNASTDYLAATFNRHKLEIEELCRLAPKWPSDGVTFARNTEYPFLIASEYVAPASPDAFTLQEVKNARSTAWVVHRRAITFVQAVKLGRY